MSAEQKVAKLGIYERGMWIHKKMIDDEPRINELRAKMDADAQAEAPLYGLGPLTFIKELATLEIEGMPGFFSLLRRYKGPILNRGKVRYQGPFLIEGEGE